MRKSISLNTKTIKIDVILICIQFCTMLGHRLDKILEYTPIIMMLILMGYKILVENKGKIRINKKCWRYLICMLLFSGYAFLSYLWCYSKSAYMEVVPSMLISIVLTVWILVFSDEENRILMYLKVFVFAATYMCIRIILYGVFVTGLRYGLADTITRPSTGWQFNMACQIIAFAAIISFYFFHTEKKKIFLVPIILTFCVEILGGSRKGLLMPIVGFAFILLCEIDKRHLSRIFKLIGYFLGVSIVAYILIRKNAELYEKMLALINGLIYGTSTDGSFSVRMFLIDKAKYLFMEKPFLGWGMNSFGVISYGSISVDVYGRYAHNNYWELLSCLGICGLILYYSRYVFIIFKSLKKHREYPIYNLAITIFLVAIIFEYGIVSYYIIPLQVVFALASSILVVKD